MKQQIWSRLSIVCTLFTLILVGTAVLNILTGRASAGWPVVIVFVWLILFQVVNYLLSLIPFKTCRQYQICGIVTNFVLFFMVWYWMGWISLNFWSILFSTINYLVFYKIIQTVLNAKRQSEADEINRELANRREQRDSESKDNR